MSDLTKTRTVLRHNGFIARHTEDVERGPVFDSADVDGGRLTVITLDQSVWDDMGQPAEITVTIEPGDLLNPGVVSEEEQEAYVAAVAACPEPFWHETHRYCLQCPWNEHGVPNPKQAPQPEGYEPRVDEGSIDYFFPWAPEAK